MLTTTRETFLRRKSAIPWSLLSKTFKDAIIVTYELGLRYIWIDSLCIIQGDTSDWKIESKKMGDVYGNSKVTIAAVKSKDGQGGCFVENDEVVSFAQAHPALNTPMAIRKCCDHYGYGAAHRDHAKARPLFSRAWTFQEELLASRVLYFGSDEIVFQCRTSLDCQCRMIRGAPPTPKQLYERSRGKVSDSLAIRESWSYIVQQYTLRCLKVESDRFPALSGLTKAFEDQGLGRFVAGLWTKDLPLWLTWIYRKGGARTKAYVAPSWSWASIVGGDGIHYSFDLFDPQSKRISALEILNVACELAGPDPTGAIRSGYLVVRGTAVLAELWPNCTGHKGRVQRGGWESEVYLDISRHQPESAQASGIQEVYCLLICLYNGTPFFLVLVAGDRAGQYQRCGIGMTSTVRLTKDCERSTKDRPGLNIGDEEDLRCWVRERPIMDTWFKAAEQQEMTLV
jgi:hypothetical protein